MASRHITPKDIFESYEANGIENMIVPQLDKYRDLKERNKKSKRDCSYVNLSIKLADGSLTKISIAFEQVLSGSRAKFPHKVEKEDAKYLNVALRKMTTEDISGGDYTPREMRTESEQKLENERVINNIESYKSHTNELVEAMVILNDACMYQAQRFEHMTKKDVAKLLTNDRAGFIPKKSKNITLYPFVQKVIKDENSGEEKELENPMVRVKLFSNPLNRKIVKDVGWNNDTKSRIYKPFIYDTRKMTKKNNYKKTLAKVKEGKKLKDLTLDNAGSFITYKSILCGVILVEEMRFSTQGISFVCKFNDELYVRRHKSRQIEPAHTVKSIMNAMAGEIEDEEDSEAELEHEEKEDENNSELDDSELDDDDDDL